MAIKNNNYGQYYESDNSSNLEKTKRLVIIRTPKLKFDWCQK